MIRFMALMATLVVAGCANQPQARVAPSGYTSVNGGADAYMHVQPKGMSNFPYQ